MGNDKLLLRVSVSQAASLFGLSERTIRSAIKNEDISYIVVRNRYKINFDSLLAWSQASTRRRQRRDARGLGQWVGQWKIKNKKYSPNPQTVTAK